MHVHSLHSVQHRSLKARSAQETHRGFHRCLNIFIRMSLLLLLLLLLLLVVVQVQVPVYKWRSGTRV
jgi:hypothetical protein